MDVGILGASGYGGGELLRLLNAHPAFKVRAVAANSSAGQQVGGVSPHLAGTSLAGLVLAPLDPEAVAGCAVVFCATPHATSLELVPALVGPDRVVVDLSGAFRLDAAAFTAWYGMPHTAADLAPAVYGLPELFRSDLRGATLIAGPGCYPTAALLALAPLSGLVRPEGIVVTGLSGWSGAGRGLRDDLHASHAHGNVSAYGAPRHRHTPEIELGYRRSGGQVEALSFTPHLVPMARGQVVTVVAQLDAAVDAAAVRGAFHERFDGEPFVTLLPGGSWPATTHVVGGNGAHIGLAVDERARAVVVSCALDNLVKGAAGQAIQAANAATGLPETTGLPVAGLYP